MAAAIEEEKLLEAEFGKAGFGIMIEQVGKGFLGSDELFDLVIVIIFVIIGGELLNLASDGALWGAENAEKCGKNHHECGYTDDGESGAFGKRVRFAVEIFRASEAGSADARGFRVNAAAFRLGTGSNQGLSHQGDFVRGRAVRIF